jgi:hypothetical protein
MIGLLSPVFRPLAAPDPSHANKELPKKSRMGLGYFGSQFTYGVV